MVNIWEITFMRKMSLLLLGFAASLAFVQTIHAASNNAPPPGAILDLNGGALPTAGYTQYSATFTATAATTNISFALRNDPGFFHLDDVTMFNNTTSSAVTVTNGGFESGVVGNNAPNNWTYLNTFGAAFSGVVSNSTTNSGSGGIGAHSGANYYYDGATQAYDGITQAISTTIGNSYTISFWLKNDNVVLSLTNFSQLSTNGNTTDTGGNGADVLLYAGAIPTMVPVPPSAILMGLGGLGLVGSAWRRRKVAA
jgi:hypothetical protein